MLTSGRRICQCPIVSHSHTACFASSSGPIAWLLLLRVVLGFATAGAAAATSRLLSTAAATAAWSSALALQGVHWSPWCSSSFFYSPAGAYTYTPPFFLFGHAQPTQPGQLPSSTTSIHVQPRHNLRGVHACSPNGAYWHVHACSPGLAYACMRPWLASRQQPV